MNPQNPQESQQNQFSQPAPQVMQPTMQQPPQPTMAGPLPYTQQPLQQQKPKSKLPLIIGLVIVIVVLVAGASLMLLGNKDEDKTASTKSSNSTPNTSEETKTSNNATTPPKTGTADSKAQDVKTRFAINSLHAKLEEYYNENNGYPATFSTTDDSTFPGYDTGWFTDFLGKKISLVAPVADKSAADKIAAPLAEGPLLQYIPYSCKGNLCDRYILRGFIANTDAYGPNPYTKQSLN